MNGRFRLNCAYVLVLSILFQPLATRCFPDILKDASSVAEDSSNAIEGQLSKLDSPIEQIFRKSSEESAPIPKRNTEADGSKTSTRTEEIDKCSRSKRESIAKNFNGIAKSNEKRSPSKVNKAPSRNGRSSARDLSASSDKDYENTVDRDKFEYSDDTEDDSAIESKSKESKYKSNEFRVGEDSEKFIDQDERSSLYDDFEAKDVVKRGITGAEDYEEMNEESQPYSEEDVDKRNIRGDIRVKREHVEKTENSEASSDSPIEEKVPKALTKRGAVDNRLVGDIRTEKEGNEQGEQQSKGNVAGKLEGDVSKLNSDKGDVVSGHDPASSDRTGIENIETVRVENRENREMLGEQKPQDADPSSNEKLPNELLGESSSLGTPSKSEESKVADISNSEATKVQVPVDNALENARSEDSAKFENSMGDARAGDQLSKDYEKRVEEQIQRKIDSIKEEIKREIAENQRMKEIEENNAKFDEIRDQEEDYEEALEAEPSDKRGNPSKRSVEYSAKPLPGDNVEKRSTKRKKRQGETGADRATDGSGSKGRDSRAATKKRSVARSQKSTSILNKLEKKREYPRQVFLVKRDRSLGKKKRKRRSKSLVPITEQRAAKLVDKLPAVEASLRKEFNDGKSGLSKIVEDEKATVETGSSLEKKFGSVSSLTGSNEEMGPLATEYGEAFGGLQGEPGVALARFKRIKRVLRPSTFKT